MEPLTEEQEVEVSTVEPHEGDIWELWTDHGGEG